jgi:hypothetical protein
MLNLLYSKIIAGITSGITAIAILKLEDMFYNRQYEKATYAKFFGLGAIVGFVAMFVLEILTSYINNTSIQQQLGGGTSTTLNISTPSAFKFAQGTPNF